MNEHDLHSYITVGLITAHVQAEGIFTIETKEEQRIFSVNSCESLRCILSDECNCRTFDQSVERMLYLNTQYVHANVFLYRSPTCACAPIFF